MNISEDSPSISSQIAPAQQTGEPTELSLGESADAAAFHELPEKTRNCLLKMGIANLKPVQAIVLPVAQQGRDVLVQAPTGSGKTLSLVLPILSRLGELEKTQAPRALVMCPTRELSSQVTSVFEGMLKVHGYSVTSVTGGASERLQRLKLTQGSDVVVGTPGRIRDLSERGILDLSQIKIFALDEVDQMLDIGFKEDLEVIMDLKAENTQTLFFSATISGYTKKLCKRLLKDPAIVKLDNKEHKPQIEHVFMKVKRGTEMKALANLLLVEKCSRNQAIIFCETKMECEDVTRTLQSVGLRAEALHGDIVQAKRNKVLHDFKHHSIDYLVATNVAARGIDVSGLPLVINFRLPYDSETYTHRVGRTGRAGLSGRAVTLFDIESKRKYQLICKDLGLVPVEVKVPTQSQIQEVSLNALKEELLSDKATAESCLAATVEAAWSEFRKSLDTETFEQVFKHLFLRVSQPHPGFEVAEAAFAWTAEKEQSRRYAEDFRNTRERGPRSRFEGGGFSARPRTGFSGSDSSRASSRFGSQSDRDRIGTHEKPRFSSERSSQRTGAGQAKRFGEGTSDGHPKFGSSSRSGEIAKFGSRMAGDRAKFSKEPRPFAKPKFGARYVPGSSKKQGGASKETRE